METTADGFKILIQRSINMWTEKSKLFIIYLINRSDVLMLSCLELREL